MARRDVIRSGDTFDPEREARRLAGAKADADRLAAKSPEKAVKRLAKAKARAQAAVVQAVTDAARKGAAAPIVDQAVKHRWRVELVQAPKDSEAPAAYVVRFDGNSPVARLSRPQTPGDEPLLGPGHVRAAERLCALHAAAVRQPRVTASYEGVTVSGGGGGGPFVDVHGAAWAKLQAGLAALLPAEREVVLDVVLWERSIAAVAARRALTGLRDAERARGAVTQTLRLGLERLSWTWGLDAAPPPHLAFSSNGPDSRPTKPSRLAAGGFVMSAGPSWPPNKHGATKATGDFSRAVAEYGKISLKSPQNRYDRLADMAT